jgi:hypothetical protein
MDDRVIRLRQALRGEEKTGGSGRPATAEDLAAPLIERLYEPLLEHCERLLRTANRPLGVEGVDLAQDAWVRLLRHLAGPNGEQIRGEEHLVRLLYRIVRSRFLDLLDRASIRNEVDFDAPVRSASQWTVGEHVMGLQRTQEGLFLERDGVYLPLIEALFESDDAFRARCRRVPRRLAKHYRALVLFQLAETFRCEVALDSGGCLAGAFVDRFRRYVELLGISSADWAAVERVACVVRSDDAALFQIVNERCQTRLNGRPIISVLRYELNQLAGVGERGKRGRDAGYEG